MHYCKRRQAYFSPSSVDNVIVKKYDRNHPFPLCVTRPPNALRGPDEIYRFKNSINSRERVTVRKHGNNTCNSWIVPKRQTLEQVLLDTSQIQPPPEIVANEQSTLGGTLSFSRNSTGCYVLWNGDSSGPTSHWGKLLGREVLYVHTFGEFHNC